MRHYVGLDPLAILLLDKEIEAITQSDPTIAYDEEYREYRHDHLTDVLSYTGRTAVHFMFLLRDKEYMEKMAVITLVIDTPISEVQSLWHTPIRKAYRAYKASLE